MRYQNPQLLYALFVIAIPIILHLLNLRKHKTIYFSSIRFLKNIKEESHKRSKLKNLLILISRILAIIFLILAFSKPYIPSNTKINNNVFIYVDNSFSMDAKNKQGILLNIAKEKARIIIDSYKHETTFYLITNDFLKIHNNSYTNNEISEQIDNITSSSSFKSINQVINKQTTIQKEFSDLYIISDMQASTIDIENISQINKNLNLFFIPIYPQTYNNITIDSCWVEEPVLKNTQTIELFTTIKNHSKRKIKSTIFLEINGQQKSQKTIELEAKKSSNIQFNFNAGNTEIINGKITISDMHVTFDNTLYFTIPKTKKIQIACINNIEENKQLNALLKNDTNLFNYKNYSINNINYNEIINKDLIILNQIDIMSSGLLNSINNALSKSKSIIVIPPNKIDIAKYNIMLEKMKINTILKIHEKKLKISNININHSIFKNVFNGKINNINFPIVNKYFETNNTKPYTGLLLLENNSNFLSVYQKQKGVLYQFHSSIIHNSFFEHALCVPTLLNIAMQSRRATNIYNTISLNTSFTTNNTTNNNQLMHLKNHNIDIVPTIKIIEGKTYYYTNNQINTSGIYTLMNNEKIIDKIAFNYNTIESNIKTINNKQINKIIEEKNLNNTEVIYSKLDKFKQKIQTKNNKSEFWRTCVILSLIFFGTEILLIKLIKP